VRARTLFRSLIVAAAIVLSLPLVALAAVGASAEPGQGNDGRSALATSAMSCQMHLGIPSVTSHTMVQSFPDPSTVTGTADLNCDSTFDEGFLITCVQGPLYGECGSDFATKDSYLQASGIAVCQAPGGSFHTTGQASVVYGGTMFGDSGSGDTTYLVCRDDPDPSITILPLPKR
jgi:hypothetical protein